MAVQIAGRIAPVRSVHGSQDARSGKLAKYNELIKLMHDEAFRHDIEAALDHHYEVLVLSTMSAGKSTLLNAMLGIELLPSRNEACTATVYRLQDHDGLKSYRCRSVIGEEITDWQDATLTLLEQWNSSGLCSLVEIQGDMPFVKNKGAQLVLYDTPGPNNARDERHALIMRSILRSQEYGLILFLLNATQLGTTDERVLLDDVLSLYKSPPRGARKQVLFVLNKVDEFDDGNGDSLAHAMQSVKTYLKEVGFKRPVIIPTMAHAAKLFRMAARGEHLSRHQRMETRTQYENLTADPFRLLRVSKLDDDIRQEIDDGIHGNGHSLLHKPLDVSGSIKLGEQVIPRVALERAVYSTGIHAIESILEKMIYTCALPETIERVAAVMAKHGARYLHQWLHQADID